MDWSENRPYYYHSGTVPLLGILVSELGGYFIHTVHKK